MSQRKAFERLTIAVAVLAALPTLAYADNTRYVNGTFELGPEDELSLVITPSKAAIGAISADTSITVTGGTLSISGQLSAPDDDRTYAYGVTVNEGNDFSYTGNLKVDVGTTGSSMDNAIGIYLGDGGNVANGSQVTMDGSISVKAQTDVADHYAYGLLTWADGTTNTVAFSGALTHLEAVGTNAYAYGVAARGKDAGNTFTFDADKTEIIASSNYAEVAGIEAYYDKNGAELNFNNTVKIEVTGSGEQTDAYGVWMSQSTVNFKGDASIVVKNTNVSSFPDEGFTRGLRLEGTKSSDPHQTKVTFSGAKANIDVEGKDSEVIAIYASGVEGVDISSKDVDVKATAQNGTSYGILAQYGAAVSITEADASVTVTASSAASAYGISNHVYGGDKSGHENQFGSVNIAGVVVLDVTAENGSAVGIFNKTSAVHGLMQANDTDGVYLTGSVDMTITAAGTGVEAAGIVSGAEHSGSVASKSQTVVNNLTATVTGNEGAAAYGLSSTAGGINKITGTSTITALGETSYGVVLDGSTLDVEGSLKATGETEGVTMSDTATVTVSEGSSFETNTMQSTGQTNLGQDSSLSVAGETGDSSSLGNVAAGNATVNVGAGSYGITNFTGDNKTVFYSNLPGNEGVTIANNSGSTIYATDGGNNDQYASAGEAAQALADTITVTQNAEGSVHEVSIAQGVVNNALRATYDPVTGRLMNMSETEHTGLSALGSVTSLGIINLRHEMNSLTKRMGELRDSPAGVGAWVRLYGSENEVGSQNVTAKNATVQVGSDMTVGDWKVGAALSYTDGRATYDAGEGDSNTYGFALYGTWLVENGQFLDLIAKYSRLDQDFSIEGMNGSYDNNAFALSAEYGWRFELGSVAFVEPQAEFTYFRVMGDDFATSNDVKVEQDDYDSYIGRIGVRGGFKFPNNKGNLYARVSYLYDFDGEMHADVRSLTGRGHNTIDEDLGGSWVEYGIGANFNLTDRTYSYVDLERSSGGEVKENWRWNIGVRHVF